MVIKAILLILAIMLLITAITLPLIYKYIFCVVNYEQYFIFSQCPISFVTNIFLFVIMLVGAFYLLFHA